MTEPNPADVTPDDRKWAHYMLLAASKVHPTHEAAILAGEWDNTDEVQFIVRHRIAALQQSRSAVVEECAKKVEEVWLDGEPYSECADWVRKLSQESADA